MRERVGSVIVIVAMLVVSGTTMAAQTVQTQYFGPSVVSFPDTTAFNQFGGTVANLNWALVEVFVTDLDSSLTGTNLGASPASGTFGFGVNANATSSVFPGTVTAVSSTGGSYNLTPNGDPGDSFMVNSSAAEGTDSYFAFTVPTKTPFVGGGTFDVDLAVDAFAGFSGDAIYLLNVPGNAGGRVVVTYDYVPEPASLALFLLAIPLVRGRK